MNRRVYRAVLRWSFAIVGWFLGAGLVLQALAMAGIEVPGAFWLESSAGYSREGALEALVDLRWLGLIWLVLWLSTLSVSGDRSETVWGREPTMVLDGAWVGRVMPQELLPMRRRRGIHTLEYRLVSLACVAVGLAEGWSGLFSASSDIAFFFHWRGWVWLGLAMGLQILAEWILWRSRARELRWASLASHGVTHQLPKRERGRTMVRWILFLLAIALVGLGIANGGMRDVLVKAINICTECIGLG